MKNKLLIAGTVVLFLVVALLLPLRRNSQQSPVINNLPNDAGSMSKAGDFKTKSHSLPATHAPTNQTIYRIGNGIIFKSRELEIDHGLKFIDLVKGEKYPQSHEIAQKKGALAAITFIVVDDQGVPVQNAFVKATFSVHNKKGYDCFELLTGENGMVALQNKCVYDLIISIKKDGYYNTGFNYYFLKTPYDCVENGRWIPWNPTIEVVLKKIRNPIPMYVKNLDVWLPKKDETFGFDFQAGDLVEPYGKGKFSDVLLNCARDLPFEFPKTFSRYLTFSFNHENEGIIRRDKDSYSAFLSLYEAPENGYQPEISIYYQRINDKVIKQKELGGSEYLLLRTRVEMDNGKITKANYAKIYSLDFGVSGEENEGGRITLSYYFNPNENDRNLEFDGENNLFKPGRRESWPRNP